MISEGRTESGNREHFLERFGGVAENAPWVAEAVWDQYSSVAKAHEYQPLVEVFGRIVRTAPREQRLELLRAHPDLACGVVASSELTEASRQEQAGAGLDHCTPREFIEFQSLNLEYRARFGFPFIIAVKGMDRTEILRRFRNRIERTPEEEFTSAMENVVRIIGSRIAEVLGRDD